MRHWARFPSLVMANVKKSNEAIEPARSRPRHRWWIACALAAIVAASGTVWHIHNRPSSAAGTAAPPHTDLRGDGYVDPAACNECHADVAETYQHTGMARTFHRPSEQSMIEDFKRANRFVHKASGLTYTMIERDGKFFQRRSAAGFDGKKTDVLEEQIDYVIGSGNHGRAYLHRTEQGKLVQLPISWYVEKGGYWNMSPGLDRTDQPDMHGTVNADCIFCHTAYPLANDRKSQDDEQALPATLPEGIDCQRCHGPGAAHINAARAKAGDDAIRKAIVNPGTLGRERQLEVCAECHLETSAHHLPNSIRNYNRDLNSYRPGEPLGDYKIYFERAKNSKAPDFETAHASYQLPRSECFQKTQMTCLTCHDPHDVPHGQQATQHYIQVCQQCHAATRDIAHDAAHKGVAMKAGSNCLTCHMPKRRPEAAVHIVLTDHRIQRFLPPGDLLAPIPEKVSAEDRTKVQPYYPKQPVEKDADLYLAVAQVNDAGIDGIGNLRAVLDSQHPKWPEPYVALGKAYAQAGQTDAALKSFQDALDRRTDDYDALDGIATTLLAANRTDEAIPFLQRGAKRYADDDRFLLNLGNTYLRQGRLSEAQDALAKTLAINPENGQARNLLGLCAVQSGDAQHAEENFREAIRLEPLLPEPHNNLANLLAGKQQFREAGFQFRRALALNPHYADAHHGLGLLLILTKQADEAGNEFQAAAAEAPRNSQVWMDLGDLRNAQGRAQDAAAAYARVLAINPSSPDANLALGAILLQQGRVGEAMPHLTAAAQGPDPDVARQAQGILAQVQR
jgi:predicted CXXCH cytochrome family protein